MLIFKVFGGYVITNVNRHNERVRLTRLTNWRKINREI